MLDYLTKPLRDIDPEVFALLGIESSRQRAAVHLLAPSMLVSRSVRECLESDLGNLDGEGYVERSLTSDTFDSFASAYQSCGPRKYNPSGPVAEYIELLGMKRVAALLAKGTGVDPRDIQVNLQPTSGSIANVAILRGLVPPGSTVLALDTASGGHLSHSSPLHYAGQTYRVARLSLHPQSTALDLDQFAQAARDSRPAAVFLGASSFPRIIDWAGIRTILDDATRATKAVLIADIAHFAGLVAAGCYPNPLPSADVVSFVGYKTFGGPKSGVIATHDAGIARKIGDALFPGLQGAPRMAEIAAMAVAAGFAMTSQFKVLIERSLMVAQAFVRILRDECGLRLAYGGSDTHMLILDHSAPAGRMVQLLEQVGILVNATELPGDIAPQGARGIRMGTVGVVQRGISLAAAEDLARLLGSVIRHFGDLVEKDISDPSSVQHLRGEVQAWTSTNLSMSL